MQRRYARGVHSAADRHLADNDARLFAANRRRQGRADVLDMGVGEILRNRFRYSSGSSPEMKVLPVSKFIRRYSESK